MSISLLSPYRSVSTASSRVDRWISPASSRVHSASSTTSGSGSSRQRSGAVGVGLRIAGHPGDRGVGDAVVLEQPIHPAGQRRQPGPPMASSSAASSDQPGSRLPLVPVISS